MRLVEWIISVLVWLSADPAAIDRESPRAAAAVSAARASLAVEAPPEPAPTPKPETCCSDCGGTGMITHGDGHRTPCPCPASCPCKRSKK
jgi:hypothetical protein